MCTVLLPPGVNPIAVNKIFQLIGKSPEFISLLLSKLRYRHRSLNTSSVAYRFVFIRWSVVTCVSTCMYFRQKYSLHTDWLALSFPLSPLLLEPCHYHSEFPRITCITFETQHRRFDLLFPDSLSEDHMTEFLLWLCTYMKHCAYVEISTPRARACI